MYAYITNLGKADFDWCGAVQVIIAHMSKIAGAHVRGAGSLAGNLMMVCAAVAPYCLRAAPIVFLLVSDYMIFVLLMVSQFLLSTLALLIYCFLLVSYCFLTLLSIVLYVPSKLSTPYRENVFFYETPDRVCKHTSVRQ